MIHFPTHNAIDAVSQIGAQSSPPSSASAANDEKLRETFTQFAGEQLFGQMLKAMRKTVGKPAYFYGGRAEELFQQQLDQVLAEKLAQSSGEEFSRPMFELFCLQRK